jgi:hypothetical protein
MVGSVLRRKFANRLPTGMRAASGGSVPCFCIKKFVDVPQLVGRRFGSDRRVQQERQNGAAKAPPRPGATAKSLFEQPQPAAAVALSAGSRPLEDAKPAGPSPLSHAGSARERAPCRGVRCRARTSAASGFRPSLLTPRLAGEREGNGGPRQRTRGRGGASNFRGESQGSGVVQASRVALSPPQTRRINTRHDPVKPSNFP